MPEFPRPASPGRGVIAFLVAVIGVTLVQAVGIGPSLNASRPDHRSASPAAATPPAKPPVNVTVEKGPAEGEVTITYPAGTSALLAQDAVRRFDLTLVSGDPATGRYVFELPQVQITAAGPGQADVIVPDSVSGATIRRFLAENQLRVIGWTRNRVEGVRWALVALPLSAAPPAPSMRAMLPARLSQVMVANWAYSARACEAHPSVAGCAPGHTIAGDQSSARSRCFQGPLLYRVCRGRLHPGHPTDLR